MIRFPRFRLWAALSLFVALSHANAGGAVSKPHVISFGKWSTVQWSPALALDSIIGATDAKLTLKIRPLLVDGRVKEFTLGPAHDVTDALFVVRRVFRVNDSLPQEAASPPHWQWQRGGWLLVDRATGHVSAVNLPEFDAVYSAASWYRDYVAYCGVSEDGKKIYAIVSQIAHRKPALKKALDGPGIAENATPDSACPAPAWQRSPARVTFEPAAAPRQTFAVRGHSVDVIAEEEDEEATR
jgi:hypothetical protein